MQRPWLRVTRAVVWILGAVALGLSGMPAATGGPVQQIAVGATQQGSSAYPFYVALGRVIDNAVPGVNTTVVESGASVDNIRQLNDGRMQLGLVTEDTAFQAMHGIGPFPAKVAGLRTLFIYDNGPQYYVTTAASNVRSLRDLTGKPWSPGFSGSATQSITKLIFGQLGIAPKYFDGSLDDIVTAIQDGNIIGFAKGGAQHSLDASILQVAAGKPLRILGFTAADRAKIQEKFPYVSWVTIAAGVMHGTGIEGPGGDLTTWAVVTSVGATSQLPQAIGYQIMKAAAAHKADLEKAYPRTKEFDYVKDTLRQTSIPLHAGTVQWLKEQGVAVPAALIPPEYKAP